VITCPAATTISCEASQLSANTGTATATDNCAPVGNIAITYTDASTQNPGTANIAHYNYTITRTWKATDVAGNTATCNQTITVQDVTAPVITCPAATTISCEASQLPANTGSATATDNCAPAANIAITYSDASTQDPDINNCGHYSYTITRTWTATDVAGNTATCNQTITVQDITAPVITCPAPISVPFTPSACGTTVPYNITATDNCSSPITYTLLTGSQSGSVFPIGTTTVTWKATDVCGNTSTCSFTVTVTKLPTTATLTLTKLDANGNELSAGADPCVQQYSDRVRFKVVIPNGVSSCGNAAVSATFNVANATNSQGMGTANFVDDGSGNLVAKLDSALYETVLGVMAPGMKTVTATLNGVNTTTYNVTSPTSKQLSVTQEDAMLTYNGFEYFTTPTTNCPATGTVNLSAYVLDTTDVYRGDIRNAKITFTDQFGNAYPNSSNLAVVPIVAGNYLDGITTSSFPMTLSGSDCNTAGKTFEVWTHAYNYYTGTTSDGTLVTLGLPGQDNITGGGHLAMDNHSAGCYAASPGTRMNFGFTMKWNKSGKNLQGQITILFRRWVDGVLRTYKIKSNAINSMAIQEYGANGLPANASNPAVYKRAMVSTKANLSDVTDPNNPVSLGGAMDLNLDAWDYINNNDGSLDKIGVTLISGSSAPPGCAANSLIFSSYWSNGATVPQFIGGGNINIRTANTNGNNSNTVGGNGSPAIKTQLRENNPATEAMNVLEVKAFPNPSQRYFTIIVESNSTEAVQVRVFDIAGRKVGEMKKAKGESISFGDNLTIGTYFAEVIQGDKRKTVKLIKQ
jgi:hypothetical protein